MKIFVNEKVLWKYVFYYLNNKKNCYLNLRATKQGLKLIKIGKSERLFF